MVKADQFVVEAHFVPLPANEADERKRRFLALLLRGALRFVQQPTDRSNKPGKPEAPKPLLVESVQK